MPSLTAAAQSIQTAAAAASGVTGDPVTADDVRRMEVQVRLFLELL